MADQDGEQVFGCAGCLAVVVLVFLLLWGVVSCSGMDDSTDCYSTPGAEPGSAQDMRDEQRCIESGGPE